MEKLLLAIDPRSKVQRLVKEKKKREKPSLMEIPQSWWEIKS
jgi:hypothetical protein